MGELYPGAPDSRAGGDINRSMRVRRIKIETEVVATPGLAKPNGPFLLIAYSALPRQRPALNGALGSMYGISVIASPLLGGAFKDNAHLEMVFLHQSSSWVCCRPCHPLLYFFVQGK
jgi:hypothetical protein